MEEEAFARQNDDNARDRIFHVAAALFAHKGYAGTSTGEITRAARVTKPTLYYYFKSKKNLYLTILGEAMRIFHDRLNLSVPPSADMRTGLRSLFYGIEGLVHDHPDVVRLVNGFLFGPRSETPCCELYGCSWFEEAILSDILRRGVGDGEIFEKDLQSILLLITGMLRCIQRAPVDGGLFPNRLSIHHYVNAVDLIITNGRRSCTSSGDEVDQPARFRNQPSGFVHSLQELDRRPLDAVQNGPTSRFILHAESKMHK
ncbi:TetR/AcrR family transcriptional regulator [Desulforhabdus amnigena]|uniref:HTH tetR-type domain-containing protein n=1 Tax=Desulforhabdus amnigena TaxID=40218 RepID=A0A9W6FR11_9BACT|nr:TetR/AcrR family transcriptional regulator [Desulforhabdus amnigena]NLJ29663.1 TetR/AcrR family transcriptional regulator [Deltaproteobacteria bacterium]GLI33062.1 hypothetical protein DAMNIGENAA_04950 [Desulforhabdus amnigena]